MLLSAAEKNDKMLGIHAWRQLLRRLLEIGTLIGIVSCDLLGSQKVVFSLPFFSVFVFHNFAGNVVLIGIIKLK